MTSTRGDIKNAIDAQLRTITTAAGYQTNVQKVYSDEGENNDKIPMGLQLDDFEKPAILALSGEDKFGIAQPGKGLVHGCVYGNLILELQLWHNEVTDSVMFAFVRDIFKCLYAGTATGTVRNFFKSLHPKIYDLKPLTIEPDLNMIEANRCFTVFFVVKYSTQLWDL